MDEKRFKELLTKNLLKYGFKRKNNNYYCSNNELISVVTLQKSKFESIYYINYGFLIKELSKNIEFPKSTVCDVRGRFILSESMDRIDLDIINEQKFEIQLDSFIKSRIMETLDNGLKYFFDKYPEMLCVANLKTKEYLHLE